MKLGLKRFDEKDFKVPRGIVNVLIDKSTGRRAKSRTSNTMMESFVEGTEPGNDDYDNMADGRDISEVVLDDDDYYSEQ